MSDGCDVHGIHRPKPLGVVVHHIWPRGMAGPDEPANRITVCDTGHRNVHRLLDDLLLGKAMRRGGTQRERDLAQQGFDTWTAAGKPGHPVYEIKEPS